jgi:hypothetical protein
MGRKQHKPRVSWLGRFIRGRRPDRNPLRRGSDWAETAVLAVLVIAFLAAAPFAARASGAWAHAIAHRVQLTQEASRYQVTAVLADPAPKAQAGSWGTFEPQVRARWTAPDGKAVTGEIPAPAGTAAGTRLTVWTSRDGQLTEPPLQDSQVADQVTLAQIGGVAALAMLLAVAGLLARRALDKRRMAAWDADWLATGPRWTTRA